MRAAAALLLAASLGLAAQPAAAQQRHMTESRLKPASSQYSATAAKDAAREMARYGRCVVDRRYDQARALVLAPYGSAEQNRAATGIVRRGEDGCLEGGFGETRMRFQGVVLAGALAQALVLRDYADLPALIRSRGVSAPVAAPVPALDPAEDFGRCIVERDPAAAFALITSVSETAGEDRAMVGLRDHLGPCLMTGQKLTINRMFLRNTLGIAAYRLATEIQPRQRARAVTAGVAR